ncbi:BTAD domain-containing putative transcriptional regulator [Streptomyces sp. NPDC001796]|uniref:AfsR/SARP family transcriptional regulator n=1 Tax=Streptomyces sp. NPDC001796 TaxID=3364609 RepID=UPI0036AC0A76
MRYRILGTAQAEDDQGTSVPLGGPRLRALLTALALRPGRTTTPQTLIDEIWPDDPPLDAPAALQALVARLRRTLGRTAVASVPGGYRLDAGRDSVDLFVFEDLVQRGTAALADGDPHAAARDLRTALALWHGPALADLPDRTAAARPEALRLTATRARVEADLRLGRAPDVVPELTELTTAHPYDEPLHALLIRALRATGRGADALAAYERARRALADGLGTDPGPELKSLHAELLSPQTSQETSAHSSAPPTPRTSGPGSPQPPTPLKPPTAPRTGNLRRRLNSFVGRELELEAIRSDLHRARLVTLTGPGGSGKTRLAEEAASGLPQAWLAELAPLDRPEAVPAAVVSALGLRETALITNELAMPQDDPVALLIEYCAPRSELLILDNCEHVIDAAAELAETLLTHCPGLTILATSREPLGVPGESVRPVEPLPPDPAHRLFLERAAAARPGPHTVHDPEAVDEICRRLDGLPLAIELAAARLRLLTPRQIADRLDDRFRLLTSGSRTVLPRQQTLRAVVDWSWDLLDERERTVLREVSVFAGGWDLAAAEAVCTGPVADLIGALVDKSLVVAAPGDGDGGTGMRYRMLETIHEYATERAAEAPELRTAAERRHRAWVRALVEEAEPELRSAEQLPWIRRLETELDNIRAALYRAIASGDEAEAGAIALATGWFWWLRNFRWEGTEWTERVLRLGAALDAGATAGSPPWPASAAVTRRPSTDVLEELAAVDHVEAFLARPAAEEGHPLRALRMNLRMLHLFLVAESRPAESIRDERTRRYTARVRAAFERGGPEAARFPGILWALTVFHLGEPYDVLHAMDAIVANCRRYGGDWEIGVALMFRAHMLVDSSGGLRDVDGDLAELRTLSRRVGDRWMRAQVSSAVGEAAMGRGSFAEAKGEYEEALRLAHEVGAYAESPFLLARLGEIAYREGKRADAQAALDEASDAADRYGVHDARGYVSLLRAQMALDDGETLRARALCENARMETARNTPPPQFIAALNGIDALVTIAESGPCHGLPKLAEALRHAVDSRCAESVTAGLVDIAARALVALGEHARAVRLLAAADGWRPPNAVRPGPDRVEAERTEAAALKALGRARFDAERARGTELTPDDVLGELAGASADHPAQ